MRTRSAAASPAAAAHARRGPREGGVRAALREPSVLALALALGFAITQLAPPLLRHPFPPYPPVAIGDVVDLLTPLLVLPLYWLMFRGAERAESARGSTLLFVVLAAIWVQGYGTHLAANSIGRLAAPEPAASLTHFYDEVLGHYVWLVGATGLATLCAWRAWRHPGGASQRPGIEAGAGLVYGFAFFASVVEGGTGPLGVPFALVAVVVGASWLWGRRHAPTLVFWTVAHATALVLFAGWGFYWNGLPQFSQLGWI